MWHSLRLRKFCSKIYMANIFPICISIANHMIMLSLTYLWSLIDNCNWKNVNMEYTYHHCMGQLIHYAITRLICTHHYQNLKWEKHPWQHPCCHTPFRFHYQQAFDEVLGPSNPIFSPFLLPSLLYTTDILGFTDLRWISTHFNLLTITIWHVLFNRITNNLFPCDYLFRLPITCYVL